MAALLGGTPAAPAGLNSRWSIPGLRLQTAAPKPLTPYGMERQLRETGAGPIRDVAAQQQTTTVPEQQQTTTAPEQEAPSSGDLGGGAAGGRAYDADLDTTPVSGPSVGALADVRQRFADELKDPATLQLLMASTQAEVGGQGANAEQAYMETVMNRAAAEQQSLRAILLGRTPGHVGYYPGTTLSKLGRTFSGPQYDAMNGRLQAVLGGSNLTRFATGNESGAVRSGGAPIHYSPGTGERYVGELWTRNWINRMRRLAAEKPPPMTVSGLRKGGSVDVDSRPTMSKRTAHYRTFVASRDNGPCKRCSMFRRPHDCTLVKGHIYRAGTCDHYRNPQD